MFQHLIDLFLLSASHDAAAAADDDGELVMLVGHSCRAAKIRRHECG